MKFQVMINATKKNKASKGEENKKRCNFNRWSRKASLRSQHFRRNLKDVLKGSHATIWEDVQKKQQRPYEEKHVLGKARR